MDTWVLENEFLLTLPNVEVVDGACKEASDHSNRSKGPSYESNSSVGPFGREIASQGTWNIEVINTIEN